MVGDAGYKEGGTEKHALPTVGPCQATATARPGDDFSSSDRGFAETLGIPFHEPTDFFGWKPFEVFNIENEDQLETFIAAIEARAAELEEEGGDEEEIERLETEAKNLRIVNGL